VRPRDAGALRLVQTTNWTPSPATAPIFKATDIQNGQCAPAKPRQSGHGFVSAGTHKSRPDTTPGLYQNTYINPDIGNAHHPTKRGDSRRTNEPDLFGKDIELFMYPICKYKFNNLKMYQENVCLYFDTFIFTRN
jgi:hypothetical protein